MLFSVNMKQNENKQNELNELNNKRQSVTLSRLVGRLLLLTNNEHCLDKKSINSSAFCLKFDIKLLTWNGGGISDILLFLLCFFSQKQWFLEYFRVFFFKI